MRGLYSFWLLKSGRSTRGAVTTERTEVDQMLGSGNGAQARTSVWEMPVMVVHESANAPEWTELKLQFECLNKYRALTYNEARNAAKARQEGKPQSPSLIAEGWNDPGRWNDPVNMRIAARSYTVPRVDLSNRPLAEAWPAPSIWPVSISRLGTESARAPSESIRLRFIS